MAEVELRHVEKRFADGTRAIRHLSLTIADGELMVLLGPSGCGKSTLLRMLAGLEEPSAGEIRIDGKRVNERSPGERNVAMVFQNYALYPHMSVRANLAFPLRMRKQPREEIARKVQATARMLGLTELLDRKPKQLSGGQAQRVAMGRALVREPALFLMDEPLSNLDAKLRVQIRREIAAVHERIGTTTVYVTHDQVEAMTLGQRVTVLRDGVVQQTGTPRTLYDHPVNVFVAGFVGRPAMSIFPVELCESSAGLRLAFGTCTVPVPSLSAPPEGERGRVRLAGLRPEAFDWAQAHPEEPRIEVRVHGVEALGHEQILYFEAPVPVVDTDHVLDVGRASTVDALMAARLASEHPVRAGELVSLAVDTSKLHWFDERGYALRAADAA